MQGRDLTRLLTTITQSPIHPSRPCFSKHNAAMPKQPTTNKPCFSCGSEAGDWVNRNCDSCKKTLSGTSFHCAIQSDIYKQWFGHGNEEIRLSSYEVARRYLCPRYIGKGTPPKHHRARKEPKGQLTIF